MSAALITACNQAISLIAKGQIASLEEASIEAREAKRFSTMIIEEMADWTEWPALIARVNLAQVTNDRPAEWLYAYAQPADFGSPLAIRKVEDDATLLPELAAPFTLPHQDRQRLGFTIEGEVIYTNVKDAAFVYVKNQLTADDFTPKMRLAFVHELAARLAFPVGKMSANKIQAMEQRALASKLEAISDAENKNDRRQPNYTSEAEFAREGYIE